MSHITIIALECNSKKEEQYDRQTLEKITPKLLRFHNQTKTRFRVLPKPEPSRHISPADVLEKAIDNFLKESDCVILVLDKDGRRADLDRRGEPNSLINTALKATTRFANQVYVLQIINEMEAWLLVDCIGIWAYFICRNKAYSPDCRAKVEAHADWPKIIKKHQLGDTQMIEEAQRGGKGAKEYLTHFSKQILNTLNPRAKDSHAGEYTESLAPIIAEYIEINKTTLGRNESLTQFGKLLIQCSSKPS